MSQKSTEPAARTLISGGSVLVLDGSTPPQEALVVEGGRVLGVGTTDEMRSLAGRNAKHLGLDGATAMPGLVDTHPHFLHFGSFLGLPVDLTDARDHDEIVERIRARAEVTPPGEWILATPVGEHHYYLRRSYRDLEERRLPDRHVLDRATRDHPVGITALPPVTPNAVAFNSLALRELGISRVTPDRVCDVVVEKDEEDGRPTGILRGPVTAYYSQDAFWLQLRSKLPPWTEEFWHGGADSGMRLAAQLGVTAAYEAHGMDPVHIDAWRKAREGGRLTLRVMCALEALGWPVDPHSDQTPEEVIERLELAQSLTELSDDYLRVNGTTMQPGGVTWTGDARSYEPYLDPFGRPTTGRTFVRPEIQRLVIEWCLENDLRLNLVQLAYRDHDSLFDVLDACLGDRDIRSRNWIAQHSIFISEAQAKRYAELGFDMTACMGFAWAKGDMIGGRVGSHVWPDLCPLKRLVDLGVNLSCSTDWGPKNVFEQMWLAETHEFHGSGHRNLLPGHALAREESLLTWTRNGARMMRWEDIGSLLAGYHADLAIVDRNPLTCELDELRSTQVLRTVVGGKTVYDTGELDSLDMEAA